MRFPPSSNNTNRNEKSVCLLSGSAGADKVNEQALKEESEQLKEKHAKTLSGLEEQYETSRYVTHVAKGAGLGYGSGSLLTELPSKTNTE